MKAIRFRPGSVSLILTLGTFLSGCNDAVDAPQSALLVTIDTVRADVVGAYGGLDGLTPNLDALAADGLLFERAYATTPLTLPSHTSMMTGLAPLRSSVRDNGYEVLPKQAETLAERAQAAGVQTVAFVSASVLHPDFGLGQGFDHYSAPADAEKRATTEFPSRRAHDVVADALSWLEQRDATRPFFLWVHLWDAHKPWEPTAAFRSRAPGNPYLQEVASADDAFGQLVQGLRDEDLLDSTTILVLADHGESLGEHGENDHGVFCYDSTVHIPLILRPSRALTGFTLGTRIDDITSVVDVAPTLIASLGLAPLRNIDGFNLLEPIPQDRGAYLESYYAFRAFGWSPIVGWVNGEAKYLHGSQPELYDLDRDPRELDNIIESHQDLATKLQRQIAEEASKPALGPDRTSISDARREDLQALGYAAGGDAGTQLPHPLELSERPSPKERTPILGQMEDAYQLLSTGQYAAAEAAYAKILEVDSENLWCRELYATCLLGQHRPREAVAPLQRVISGGRGTAITFGNLGHALAGSGRDSEAITAFREALDLNPVRLGALKALVRLTKKIGQPDVALPFVRRYEEQSGTSFSL